MWQKFFLCINNISVEKPITKPCDKESGMCLKAEKLEKAFGQFQQTGFVLCFSDEISKKTHVSLFRVFFLHFNLHIAQEEKKDEEEMR